MTSGYYCTKCKPRYVMIENNYSWLGFVTVNRALVTWFTIVEYGFQSMLG